MKTSGFQIICLSLALVVNYGTCKKCNCVEPVCEDACFDYSTSCRGPPFWAMITSCWSRCRGDMQSPVNIVSQNTLFVNTQLNIHNLKTPLAATIKNKGLKTQFKVVNAVGKRPFLRNVPYRQDHKYILDNVHLHIGQTFAKGSEHSVDGIFYPIELHAVFYNDRYPDVEVAAGKKDGLTVLGVLVQIKSCTNVGGCRGRKAVICNNVVKTSFKAIREPDSAKVDVTFTLRDLLPKLDSGFYTYEGSLTTPPCFETVQWVVQRCPITISKKAYEAVASLKLDNGQLLKVNGNRRPIQRGQSNCSAKVTIYRNFPICH